MIEEKLENIDTGISNLYDALTEEKFGNNGQTTQDSLENIEYWLRSISESLEKIANNMK